MNGQQAVDWSYRYQTLRECLKSSVRFGETIYYNLCNGQQQAVPWGGVDWLIAIGVIAFASFVTLAVLGAIFFSNSDHY